MTHHWLPKEDKYIRASYMTLSRGQMAKHLKVTVDVLSAHMNRIEVRRYKPWTDADDTYILKNYRRTTCVEMAAYLDRTPNILRTRLWNLGLRRYEKNVGAVVLPPQIDVMHREAWKPAKWECLRDGAMDFMQCPSVRGVETVYRDRGHV